jgi:hypothetical protein
MGAGVLTAPSAYHWLFTHRLTASGYLIRFLLAFLFCCVATSIVTSIVEHYRRANAMARSRQRRRRDDPRVETVSESG